MVGRSSALLALCLASAAVIAAAPALTTIEDILYRADGSKFSGVVFIEWRTFQAADSTAVPSRSLTARVTAGLVRVSLIPTTNATPPAYYRVRYNSDGRTDFTEYWAVPPSTVPLRVRDVRTEGPQSSSPVPPVNTAITIPDVSGLRDELDNRPTKGGSYLSGRVVMANDDGSLESVSGAESDCVRVDGTAGPCGGGGYGFIDAETPGGVIDGVNRSFTLAEAPNPIAGLNLYKNGLRLRSPAEFTIAGPEVTFVAGHQPAPGDVLLAFYRVPSPESTLSSTMQVENPSGLIDGSNTAFFVSIAPAPAAGLQLYRNGLLLKQGLDYTLVENAITFPSGALPNPGDELLAVYRY